jgi:hypothetical protein
MKFIPREVSPVKDHWTREQWKVTSPCKTNKLLFRINNVSIQNINISLIFFCVANFDDDEDGEADEEPMSASKSSTASSAKISINDD